MSAALQYRPQIVSARASLARSVVAWAIITVAALLPVALIAAAPILESRGHTFLSLVIYKAFSHLCHQMPERSFFFHNHPLAVCARCSGLYAGFAIGSLTFPVFRSIYRPVTPNRVWLLLALVPTAVDFGLNLTGIVTNTHMSRVLTGALLGAVAALYVVPGFVDVFHTGLRAFLPGSRASDSETVTDHHMSGFGGSRSAQN
jgi:uncharacterized membrane protein